MNNKISDKDKKDWEDFIKSNERLEDKDNKIYKKKPKYEETLDLHGYGLRDANIAVKNLIINSYNNGIKKIKIITGKGNRSNNIKDPYKSNKLGIFPKNMEQLVEVVKDNHCDIGLAFDGDGDRLGVVDNLGYLVWADQYMLLLCTEIANLYDNPKIIMDVKCSKVFFDEAKKLNCDPIMSKTGHSPIKEKMKELKSPLSGEMSGHVCYADDFYGYDDAMYVALRLLRILCNQEKSLNELINIYPKTYSTPETRFDVDETKKFLIIEEIKERIKNTEGKIIDIDGIRVENDDGWFLMRASNTQNQLTCRAESTSQEGLKSLIAIIENQLSQSGVNYKFTV